MSKSKSSMFISTPQLITVLMRYYTANDSQTNPIWGENF